MAAHDAVDGSSTGTGVPQRPLGEIGRRALLRKSAIVLWSGASRPVSDVTSRLRPASRSSRRLIAPQVFSHNLDPERSIAARPFSGPENFFNQDRKKSVCLFCSCRGTEMSALIATLVVLSYVPFSKLG